MSVPLTSGCVRGADPDLRGFLPEVQECLSAMSETLLCPVFTSYPAEKGVFFQMVLFGAMAVFVSCKHKQHITRHINKSIGKKHDRYIVL